MKSFVLLGVVLLAHYCAATAPVAGDAGWAIQFDGRVNGSWGEIGGAGLIDSLGGSWTLELWFSADQPQSNRFQPLVSHYPEEEALNAFIGFNLQIWPNGQLCYFMGNGAGINKGYGILYFGTNPQNVIQANKWYHVVVVHNSESDENLSPQSVTIYLGREDSPTVQVGHELWNQGEQGGARQIPNSRFSLGRFDNFDPSVQTFAGKIDEVRFWNYPRTLAQIQADKHIRFTGNEEGLQAYYNFDSRGIVLVDETDQYHGSIFADDNWKYDISQARVYSRVPVATGQPLVITLSSTSNEVLNLQYYLQSLPSNGKLYLVNEFGAISTTEVTSKNIQNALPSNKVAYISNASFLGSDYFGYTVLNRATSQWSPHGAKIFLVVTEDGTIPSPPPSPIPGCDGVPGHVYDDCGVCNGDGTSCTCVNDNYRNYSLVMLDRILVHYNIEYTLGLIDALEQTLQETLTQVFETDPHNPNVDLEEAVTILQTFNTHCLTDFQGDMSKFLEDLITANQFD